MPTQPLANALESQVSITQGERFCIISATLKGARILSPGEFEHRTAELYEQVRQALKASPTPHPVRFWNCIPAIHAPTGKEKTRYMDFNAGRFAAFTRWFRGSERFIDKVPSASAVGYEGDDLTVHCLGSGTVGRAVANPRQIASYQYSRRFGPLPPCFARATVVETPGEAARIFVGGTASIVGEDSVHLGSLREQAAETFENLACLATAACNQTPYDPAERRRWLARYRALRVYFPNATDQPSIEALVCEAFPQPDRVELVQADLCRPELLIEIEGLAEGMADGTRG